MGKNKSSFPAFKFINGQARSDLHLYFHSVLTQKEKPSLYEDYDDPLSYFSWRLGGLRYLINLWRKKEPNHPIHNYSSNNDGIYELVRLEGLIDQAEVFISNNNHLELAEYMYLIGEAVGTINHTMGWSEALEMTISKGKARTKNKQLLKEETIRLFNQGDFLTIPVAARTIAPQLRQFAIDKNIRAFAPSNEIRRVEDYLREAKKERRLTSKN